MLSPTHRWSGGLPAGLIVVCQDRPEAVWGSSPESISPSELVSVDQCLTATRPIKSQSAEGHASTKKPRCRGRNVGGLHFGLDFAAELGQRDPRPMLFGRSLVAARRQATDTRSVELGANTKRVAERPGDKPPTQARWSWERTRNAWQRGQATSHRHKARWSWERTRNWCVRIDPRRSGGSSPESRAPSELASVDQCLTATRPIKSQSAEGTRRPSSRDAEAEMLAGSISVSISRQNLASVHYPLRHHSSDRTTVLSVSTVCG